MSDLRLIERLREMQSIRRNTTPLSVAIGLAQEAADRIEALEAELERVGQDARRWRWWRNLWPALTSMQSARFAGLDLSRTYVDSPEKMDAVTDAAMARPSLGAAVQTSIC